MVGMLRTATCVLTLLSVRTTLTQVVEWWVRTYVTNSLGSVNDCYVEQVSDDGHIERLGVPTKINEDY